MGKKESVANVQTLNGIVASYTIVHGGDKSRIEQNLPILADYLKRRHVADIQGEELLKKVLEQKTAFDSVERKVRISAKLFTRDGVPRKAKYRSGSEFCSECEMFKNFHKECPYCGRLEITK